MNNEQAVNETSIKQFTKEKLGWDGFDDLSKDFLSDKCHGFTLSCKIVIPSFCQASCDFCFNKLNKKTKYHNSKVFVTNLENTIPYILEHTKGRKVSFDITGNEPTFNIELLLNVCDIIQKYRKKYDNIDKVVMTTNAFHLNELIHKKLAMQCIDIINISMHSIDFEERCSIFKTNKIPNNDEIKWINEKLSENGVTTTSVAVVYQKKDDFEQFIHTFYETSQQLGFLDSRIRINYIGDSEVREQFFSSFKDITYHYVPGLHTKKVNPKTTIYLGVRALTKYVLGAEVIIDDNGLPYLDYGKHYALTEDIVDDVCTRILLKYGLKNQII